MTQSELIENLNAETGIPKTQIKELLGHLVNQIKVAVKKEGSFRYTDLGTFKLRSRKARMGINPQTKQPLKIAASRTVGFKASRTLRAAVSK